ncbi:GNAT family N-acetyltransferase [Tindallia californiensis]|uniref:N-acetyltransferase domain-containing protein n=1 Tax=Tindallia californiensis TaxID=159292 RepID=A0A1H3MAF3_9FIRM|nr:GNAT family N-acetyltransferase [Tindallia californiensis]SDY73700.1 hypothetical protein SAMN05192546_10460 [Tindallia californiensis]
MIPGSVGKEKIVFRSYIEVRRVNESDINSVFQIAASVGTGQKDSSQGFLVDNYSSDPTYYKEKFSELAKRLDHFYVAENVTGKNRSQIVGFLIGYTKSQWLEDNPSWLEDVHWHPSFDQERLNDFIVVDKTAIQSYLTGHGIGSELYKRLIKDIRQKNIETMLAETIISPTPNFASLAFRKKQNYHLAGVRYEDYIGETFTDLIYYKDISEF